MLAASPVSMSACVHAARASRETWLGSVGDRGAASGAYPTVLQRPLVRLPQPWQLAALADDALAFGAFMGGAIAAAWLGGARRAHRHCLFAKQQDDEPAPDLLGAAPPAAAQAPGTPDDVQLSAKLKPAALLDQEDTSRRNLLLQGAYLAFGASVFFPAGRQTPWYQFAIAQLQGSGESAMLDDFAMLVAVAKLVPRSPEGVPTRVLDLGAGTGGDLKFILGASLPGPLDIVAVEPNTFTWDAALKQAGSLGLAAAGDAQAAAPAQARSQEQNPDFATLGQPNSQPAALLGPVPAELEAEGSGAAEGSASNSVGTLSFVEDVRTVASGSVALAVCKSVLCSVEDPVEAVRELFRVLRPGGVLVFVEHVAAPQGSALRLAQEAWKPLQQAFAGGCDPARESYETIRQTCPWSRVVGQPFEVEGDGPIAPHVRGFAVK